VKRRIVLSFTVLTVFAVGQTPAPAPVVPAPAAIGSYKDLKYPPLPPLKIPEPAQFTLSNGMRVFLLEDHELPLVRGLGMVRTGNLFDPPDKHGLSQIMADVMRSGGTKDKTGDQIDEELEDMAASVESSMDETSATVNFSALKETSDAVLKIFHDVLTSPEFRQDKLDLSLLQMRGGIARRNDEADAIPGRELASILYGRDTSYGWQIEYADLDRIKREDLAAFYRRYYFPKNIMLAVYGDFSTAEMRDKLEKLFGSWTVEQPAVPAFPKVTAKPAPGIYFAEKPDVTQTFFSIGHLGGTFLDKDYAALEVAANILGQGFTSRLVSQIRTKLGYAYSIAAVWSANYDHPGTFQIVGSTKSVSTVDALKAINVELAKIRQTEVTARELDEAKQGVLNGFVFFFDSPAKTLTRVMRYEYFGYPKDFLFRYQKAVEGVTRADVLRVAKEHFHPEDLAVVAVGNSKEFGKPLSELGKVNTLDLTIPEPKQAAAPADNSTPARGRQILERAQQAMGGADKLAAIKDVRVTRDMSMTAGGMKIKQESLLLAPNYLRQEQTLPFGKMTAYSDGKAGWLAMPPQGVLPMPLEVLKQAQGFLFRDLPGLMLSTRDATRKVNLVAENTVEITAGDGQSVKVEFDPATGLPARETYSAPGVGGAGAAVVETLSDWRETAGLKMPFKSVLEQNGQKAAEASVVEYKFNTGLTAEELGKRP
jgi:predicted Zn-dependent peptidase